MSVRLDGEHIHLEGPCRVEEAEPLVRLLQENRALAVDLRRCEQLHAAVLQALLVLRPKIAEGPTDDFLRTLLAQASEYPLPRDEDQ